LKRHPPEKETWIWDVDIARFGLRARGLPP
jgi:hypothetical protein